MLTCSSCFGRLSQWPPPHGPSRVLLGYYQCRAAVVLLVSVLDAIRLLTRLTHHTSHMTLLARGEGTVEEKLWTHVQCMPGREMYNYIIMSLSSNCVNDYLLFLRQRARGYNICVDVLTVVRGGDSMIFTVAKPTNM